MAPERHLGQTVMYGSCCVLLIFAWKTAGQKYFFSNTLPKKAEVVNLKNSDLDLIRSILLECGYLGFMIRFLISPQKTAKSVFGIKNPFSDFPPKTYL